MSPPYTLVVPKHVEQQLDRIQRRDRARVSRRIAALSTDPRPRRVEKLTADRDDRYRVRQSDWRIIYTIDDRNRTVVIDEVARRNEATYGR